MINKIMACCTPLSGTVAGPLHTGDNLMSEVGISTVNISDHSLLYASIPSERDSGVLALSPVMALTDIGLFPFR